VGWSETSPGQIARPEPEIFSAGRSDSDRSLEPQSEPEFSFEIELISGGEGRELRLEQARAITQSIDNLRDRVSGAESSRTAGVGAVVTRLQRLEESVERLHEGQMDIRERLARLEGESAVRKPTLWDPQEGSR
jgi:hypothetical protein